MINYNKTCTWLKSKNETHSQPWRNEIWFASLQVKSHWNAWILSYIKFNRGWCMCGAEQATYLPVLWAVPKTGYFSRILPVIHWVPSPSCSTFPWDAEFAVPMRLFDPHDVQNIFKHLMAAMLRSVWRIIISAFSYLKLVTGTDSALIYIFSLPFFVVVVVLIQSGFNSGHLINQTQTICCSPVSCWSALPAVTCFRAAVSHCLFLCQLFYC